MGGERSGFGVPRRAAAVTALAVLKTRAPTGDVVRRNALPAAPAAAIPPAAIGDTDRKEGPNSVVPPTASGVGVGRRLNSSNANAEGEGLSDTAAADHEFVICGTGPTDSGGVSGRFAVSESTPNRNENELRAAEGTGAVISTAGGGSGGAGAGCAGSNCGGGVCGPRIIRERDIASGEVVDSSGGGVLAPESEFTSGEGVTPAIAVDPAVAPDVSSDGKNEFAEDERVDAPAGSGSRTGVDGVED